MNYAACSVCGETFPVTFGNLGPDGKDYCNEHLDQMPRGEE